MDVAYVKDEYVGIGICPNCHHELTDKGGKSLRCTNCRTAFLKPDVGTRKKTGQTKNRAKPVAARNMTYPAA
jgi:tRNA(Ile2) C34 agmatinyltransferase TiaS